MALQFACPIDDTWVICENAYFKLLWDIKISWNMITYSGRVYSCKDSRLNNKNEIESRTLWVEYNGNIPTDELQRLELLYTLTKNIPEYQNSIDV